MRIKSISFYLITGLLLAPSAMNADDFKPLRVLNDSLPEQWTYNENFSQELPSDDRWWSYFEDPVLDSLITAGENNNYNILMAARRIEVARQSLNSIRAGYFPTFNLSGGWTKSRNSGALGSVMTRASTVDYFSLGIDMSWEIDIFGRIATKAKGAKASYNATRAEYAAVMTSLCSNIAKTYITLRMWQAELLVAQEHIASQEKILKMTEARHEAGLCSMLDVTQARIVFYSTQATLPQLKSSIHTTINALALLLGEYPEALNERLSATAPLPSYHHIVTAGIPMELLRRRPDIVEAEYQLAASAAQLGIAKKEFLPTLTLNGSIGTSAHRIGDMFKNDSFTYAIAPTLSCTIFDGLARNYNMASARASMEIEMDNYNLTVMTAVEEVDNAMSTYLATLDNIEMLKKVIEQSRKSLELSVDLYKSDLSAFSNVVDAQMSLLENQNSLVAAQGKALTSLVALYQALGGGWDITQL